MRYISSGARAAQITIISSGGTEALAPNTTEPHKYPRNAANARQMPAHPLQTADRYESLTETTKSFKHVEEGEETKGVQCSGGQPPFQESGQENRAADRKIHERTTEDGGRQIRGHEYEGQLRMKRTVSLSFDPTHNVSEEGGTEEILRTDDSSWEVINYPTCLV